MSSSLQNGIDAAKAGRMQEALEYLKDAIIEEPQNANVWVWIAAIIDDIDKQEIFLAKALEIDPNNKPAQRGMAFVRKKKTGSSLKPEEHITDYTKPITPFPEGRPPNDQEVTKEQARLNLSSLDDLTSPPKSKQPSKQRKKRLKANSSLPKLSAIEIILLSVVVIVFCFIGVLAASSLLNIELPSLFSFLSGGRPKLENDPPYQGVFLYENNIFFEIKKHQGMPVYEVGIPTSFKEEPVIVVWTLEADVDHLKLVYETGEYITLNQYEENNGVFLLQPDVKLRTGLYCLQQGVETLPPEEVTHWCFRIKASILD